MEQTEQQFLNDLDKKLWSSADKLRSNLDAAVYKHAEAIDLVLQQAGILSDSWSQAEAT